MVKSTVEKAFRFFENKKQKEIQIGMILLEKIFESFSGMELTEAWIVCSDAFFGLGVDIVTGLKAFYGENKEENKEEEKKR